MLLLSRETVGNREFERETEKKGLDTPVTRAGIIEKLVSSGYVVRKGRQLLPTAEGTELIGLFMQGLIDLSKRMMRGRDLIEMQ